MYIKLLYKNVLASAVFPNVSGFLSFLTLPWQLSRNVSADVSLQTEQVDMGHDTHLVIGYISSLYFMGHLRYKLKGEIHETHYL